MQRDTHDPDPSPVTTPQDAGAITPDGGFSPGPIPLPRTADAQVLADERRRAVYVFVTKATGPITVNEVAEAFGIHRNAAKHHLDRLLESGLLKAEFRRVNGRRGPGAGRPSKLYSSTDAEISFSVPERHYDLLAHLLLQALTQGDDLEHVGARFGRQLAEARLLKERAEGREDDPADGIHAILDGLGFRPTVERDEDGHYWISSESCPFGWVAVEATEGQVCKLDRSIIAGVLDGYGVSTSAVLGHSTIAGGQGTCVREAVPSGRATPAPVTVQLKRSGRR
jgi:predicted ArsR family transcriptional regulator